MLARGAIAVIAKRLDHSAIGDGPLRALVDHPFQLYLQRRQPRDPCLDRGQLLPGDGIGSRAGLVGPIGQAQQVADRFQREAEIAGMTDEGQPCKRRPIIEALVARAALGFGQQADLLVIADRRQFDPCRRAKLSNRQHRDTP